MTSMEERHSRIFGAGFEYKFDPDVWTMRANTLKSSASEIEDIFKDRGCRFEIIPWCKDGFWVWTDHVLTKTKEYSEGMMTSQSSSSMVPPILLDPNGEDMVLDMAASPGSKTTQMAAMMVNEGAIIANDVDKRRLVALRSNLQRCGVLNVATTVGRGEEIWKSGMKFDKILLDAPCTGTGTMNPRILKNTGERLIGGFSKRQKSLIESASKSLKDGGVLVYSTCSVEPEENEAVVDFAVESLGMRTIRLDIEIPKKFLADPVSEWDVESYVKGVSDSFRILPTGKTEGFFACALSL
ncbi:MAG: NOL1/NOP2/sun family putative RNA methylase [Candidatus Aenigmarchaeota archaeon]|nr:NOL1/NOP2/sun family putative RNA methylase [Candidatus Aenigmarchaeota archaeon]